MQNLTTEELEQQLNVYKEKFAQIEAVIKQDPNNEVIVKAREDLLDVINLSEDLLKLRKKPHAVTLKEVSSREKEREKEKERETEKRPREEPDERITEDGEQQVEVEEEIEDENGRKQIVKFTIPKSLKILPSDSEEVRHHKRKRIKAIKSQFRKQKMEETRTEKRNAWQDFLNKGNYAKQKQSMFKSPDTVEGKVGVVGSGQKLTPASTFNPANVAKKSVTSFNPADNRSKKARTD